MRPRDAPHGTLRAFCIMHPKDVHHVALCAAHHSAARRGSSPVGSGQSPAYFSAPCNKFPGVPPGLFYETLGLQCFAPPIPRAAARPKKHKHSSTVGASCAPISHCHSSCAHPSGTNHFTALTYKTTFCVFMHRTSFFYAHADESLFVNRKRKEKLKFISFESVAIP